jgi:hypothetical protein
MSKLRKFDGIQVNHNKHGEGTLNGVNISLRHTHIGVNFLEGDDTVFRLFTIKTINFYKMLLTKNIKI